MEDVIIKDNGPLASALFLHLKEYYGNKDNGSNTQQEATSTDDRQNQPSS
jgi:hypothetical protein